MQSGPNSLSLRQLRAFVAVARNGSFVSAAKELFVSPPALSETIRQLEEQVGVRLLDRTTRRVERTRAGEEFYADTTRLLGELEVSVRRMRDLGSASRGHVRVTGVASVLSRLTGPCIASLMKSNPGITFEVVEDGTANILSAVLDGTVDIGIGALPPESPSGLHVTPLMKDRYGVVARKGHEVFGAKRLTLASIGRWPYLSIPFGGEIARSLDGSLSPKVRVNNFAALIPMLDAGAGISILPYLAAELTMTPQLAFRALDDTSYTRKVSLIRRQARSLSPAAQLLWDAMVQSAPSFLTLGTPKANRHLLEV